MIARNTRQRSAAFTLVEMLTAVAVLGFFTVTLLTMWNSLGATAMNTTAYSNSLSRRDD